MQGIIWIASYPKSGSTWLRVFLANWLSGSDEPVPIGELHKYALSFQDNWPALWKHVTGNALPNEAVQLARRAEVQRALPAYAARLGTNGSVVFCKTHSARGLIGGYETIASDITLGAINIVRDPRAIAPSLARFNDLSMSETVAMMADADSRLGGRKVDQYVSSWSRHVQSWLNTGLTLRYEDLPKAFENVLTYLNLPIDGRLAKAIEFSSLSEMKRQEGVSGFPEAKNGRFFGDTSQRLPEDLRKIIERDHAVMMSTLGYL